MTEASPVRRAQGGMMIKARRIAGFTLIELMIVVVVIAVLAAVAIPSYQDSVRKGRRSAAQSFLMDVAQRQQQYFGVGYTYAATLDDLKVTVPSEVSPYYDITIVLDAGPPAAYRLEAEPKGAQASGRESTQTLDSAGVKKPDGAW